MQQMNNQSNNDYISKETLFNDLPENLKKQLVELRNLSQQKYTFGMSHPLKNMCENVTVPDCKKLQEQFTMFVDIFNNLNEKDIIVNPDYFQEQTKEFTTFKNFYKNNINNLDIANEFEATIAMMEKRYKEISTLYKKKI